MRPLRPAAGDGPGRRARPRRPARPGRAGGSSRRSRSCRRGGGEVWLLERLVAGRPAVAAGLPRRGACWSGSGDARRVPARAGAASRSRPGALSPRPPAAGRTGGRWRRSASAPGPIRRGWRNHADAAGEAGALLGSTQRRGRPRGLGSPHTGRRRAHNAAALRGAATSVAGDRARGAARAAVVRVLPDRPARRRRSRTCAGALELPPRGSATAAPRATLLRSLSGILWCPGQLDDAERAGHEAVALLEPLGAGPRAGDGLREPGLAGHEPRGRRAAPPAGASGRSSSRASSATRRS